MWREKIMGPNVFIDWFFMIVIIVAVFAISGGRSKDHTKKLDKSDKTTGVVMLILLAAIMWVLYAIFK
jgi:uncharacterized membrane protein